MLGIFEFVDDAEDVKPANKKLSHEEYVEQSLKASEKEESIPWDKVKHEWKAKQDALRKKAGL